MDRSAHAPPIYRRGAVWWCRVHGQRLSTGCKDKDAARERARQIERELVDPTYRAAHEATLGVALTDYLDTCRARNKRAGTLDSYSKKARQLARVLGPGLSLRHLTAALVERYDVQRRAEGASGNTVHKELGVLRRALSQARRAGLFDREVAAVVASRSPEYTPRSRWLTEGEAAQLVRHLARADRADGKEPTTYRAAWVALALATGARRSEVESLRVEDIRLASRTILIRGTKTASSYRTIPILALTEPLVRFALAYGDGKAGRIVRPWPTAGHALRDACRALGIERCSPNDFRRSLVHWLALRGVPDDLVIRLTGHTSTRMIREVYGRLSAAQIGQLIDGASALRSAVPNLYRTPAIPVDLVDTVDGPSPLESLQNPVPRDGIEPPTRGFSVPGKRAQNPRKTGTSR